MNPISPTVIATLMPLADSFDGHHGWGGGWWVVMALGMLIVLGVVIAAAVWLTRELAGRPGPQADGSEALGILDRRLAEGAISTEEYGERRRALLDASRLENADG